MSISRNRSTVTSITRVTLTPKEAADAVGCSRTFFDEWIADELRWVRRGRMKFVPVVELERWVGENAARTLEMERQR